MSRRVRENRLHVLNRQLEIRRDLRFIDASLPIVDNVIGWHPSTLYNWAAALHARVDFNKRTR
jgi:hypothetical protein